MTNVFKDPNSYANEIIQVFMGDAPAALAAYTESMAWDKISTPRVAPLSYMTAVRDLLEFAADAYQAEMTCKSIAQQTKDLKNYGRTFI
tara:strand:- start:118 stop:384 length:267 start_codon:yes stop_codon:yes gene_type:complete